MKFQTKCHAALKEERGFSLVETIIVVSLIAIISGFAITTLNSFLPRFRLSSAAREVLTDLMNARMQAVSKKHQMLITFPSLYQYTIIEDKDNNGALTSGEPSRTYDMHSSFGDVTVASSPSSIIFKPLGTASGATITITSVAGAGTKTVLVSLGGRVKIQ